MERVAGPLGDNTTTEGPVWDGKVLYFTNIKASEIWKYDPATEQCTLWRNDTDRTNGLGYDRQGRLYGCSAGRHAIIRFEDDGSITQFPNMLDGKRHSRPNDIAIDAQGRIWFSDSFGRGGSPDERQLDHTSVLRLTPQPDGEYKLERMTFDTTSPNGILLSKDERTLYLACGGYIIPTRELRAYPIQDDGTLGPYKLLHSFGKDAVTEEMKEQTRRQRPDFAENPGIGALGTHRGIDGMTLDNEGNIVAMAGWDEAGPGPMIYVFSPTGRVLETHPIPDSHPTNITFGDPDLGTLYFNTGSAYLYRVRNTGRTGWAPHLK